MTASRSRALVMPYDAGRGGMASGPKTRPTSGILRTGSWSARNARGRRRRARKIAVIVWHLLTRSEDYAWVRPALHAKKLRDLELRSGQPARRGQRGAGYEYNLTKSRQEERQRGKRAEIAYKRLIEGWTKGAAMCLRAPQRRRDNEDSAVRPSPPARLFVTRSPADSEKISRSYERDYSTSSVVYR